MSRLARAARTSPRASCITAAVIAGVAHQRLVAQARRASGCRLRRCVRGCPRSRSRCLLLTRAAPARANDLDQFQNARAAYDSQNYALAADLFRGLLRRGRARRPPPARARVAQVPGRGRAVPGAQAGGRRRSSRRCCGSSRTTCSTRSRSRTRSRACSPRSRRAWRSSARAPSRSARAPRPSRPPSATRPPSSSASASTAWSRSPAPSASRSGTRAGSRCALRHRPIPEW